MGIQPARVLWNSSVEAGGAVSGVAGLNGRWMGMNCPIRGSGRMRGPRPEEQIGLAAFRDACEQARVR